MMDKATPKPNTLLAYIRKSRLDDDATLSPARQRAAIERWATDNGPYRLEWFQDLDLSGTTAQRPGWTALLDRLDDAGVIGIVAEDQSRIFRNRTEMGQLRLKLEANNQQLFLIKQAGIDDKTASGRMLLGIQAEIDEFWARVTSEKMRDTIHYLINQEGRYWGQLPFGCDFHPDTKHLVPTQKTYVLDSDIRRYHDALRFVYETYAQGRYSYRDVAQLANAAGWRYWRRDLTTPQRLSAQAVRYLVGHWELYAGELPPTRYSTRAVALPGGHDPILPVELCRQVGRVLKRRSRERNPGNLNRPARLYPLSGILYCAHCGCPLAGHKSSLRRNGKSYTYYRYRHMHPQRECRALSNSIEALALERQIIDRLLAFAQQKPILDEIIAEMRESWRQFLAGEDQSPLAELEQKQAEMERLIDLEVSGLITREQFVTRRAAIQAEVERLQQKTATVNLVADLDQIIDRLLSNLDRLPEADLYLQKEIIHGVIERIEVDDAGAITRLQPHEWAAPLFNFVL